MSDVMSATASIIVTTDHGYELLRGEHATARDAVQEFLHFWWEETDPWAATVTDGGRVQCVLVGGPAIETASSISGVVTVAWTDGRVERFAVRYVLEGGRYVRTEIEEPAPTGWEHV